MTSLKVMAPTAIPTARYCGTDNLLKVRLKAKERASMTIMVRTRDKLKKATNTVRV